MRTAEFVVLALIGLVLGSAEAQAYDSGPVIVVPGRHGRPVIINGVDVTGAVIEGDWGLYRPHMVNPTIIAAPVFIPGRIYQGSYYQGGYDRVGNDRGGSDEGGYFPSVGREPGYGRHEIEPPADRPLPPPARRFHRSWSTASQTFAGQSRSADTGERVAGDLSGRTTRQQCAAQENRRSRKQTIKKDRRP